MSQSLAIDESTPEWSPYTWRGCSAGQQPFYEDAEKLARVSDRLARLPPLVTASEILELKRAVAEAQDGQCFLLHGGDCAESFQDCTNSVIANGLKILLQMSVVLAHGMKNPVVRIGRFAGQYAKPRSADFETRNGISLPSFRGDIVNGAAFDCVSRRADPARLLEAHAHSAMTLNFIRALIESGIYDLDSFEDWQVDWIEQSPRRVEYRRTIDEIMSSPLLMKSPGEPLAQSRLYGRFYSSHEALLLHYEEALIRRVPGRCGWYNLSTHFPWIGMRTSALDGAHVELLRGIANPIAVKIGPTMTPDTLLRLIEVLNPYEEPGRLTLITRMGCDKIAQTLPALIKATRQAGRNVLWVTDPMHGNTENASNGYKTRHFDSIYKEINLAFAIHAAEGGRLGGVHLELTGEDVTECLGGARALVEKDLGRAYKTLVDPRLNGEQALELSMLIAAAFRSTKNSLPA